MLAELRRSGFVLVLLLALLARAGAQMTLTLTDGTTTRGSLAGIAPNGSWSWRGLGGPMTVEARRVVSLESGDALVQPQDESFRMELSSGDSVIGRIEDGSSDDVRVRSAAFGDATFSLDDVVGIWNLAIPHSADSLPPPQGDAETLYIDRDGRVDPTPGRLERIGKNQLTFRIGRENRTFSFNQHRVIAVRWKDGASKASKDAPAIVHLKDGSRLSGTLHPSDGASIGIKLLVGPDLTIDPRFLKSLSIRNQSLQYLSDLDPAGFTETPLFSGALLQGLQRDRGLRSGQLLRIGRQSYPKGLLVPAHGRVSYALDGKYSRFAATAGVDGAREGHDLQGSIKATVFVDGKQAWSEVLRAGQPPNPVEVGNLKGARELAIEVDFAESWDAGARAVFANAMLIR